MNDEALRGQLLGLLDGEDARMTFEDAVADFPDDAINVRPPNVSYTPWHILEHLRITQWDIREYIGNPRYAALEWPKDYWPAQDALAGPAQLAATIASFHADGAALRELVADPATDLYAVLPNTPGHTILREIRIVAEHNAYHIGEFAILRQVMGTWPEDRGG